MRKTIQVLTVLSVLIAVILGCQAFQDKDNTIYVLYTEKSSDLHDANVYVNRVGAKVIKQGKYVNAITVRGLDEVKAFQEVFGEKVMIEPLIEVKANIGGCSNPKPKDPNPNQPTQMIPWGIKAVHAPEAWSITRGAGIIVCVVDTGLDYLHPDFEGRVAGGENLINPGADYYDDADHGTHVAGTIAAADNSIGVVGVAPLAKIYAAKVLNSFGSGSSQDVADGILACVANGAHVINMSLGSTGSSGVIQSAIKVALDAGIVVIAAAGNSGKEVGYPAANEGVYAISATDKFNKLASFSNFGSEIDFAGPGVDVLSCVPPGEYDSYNGTSMSSPHVAGVAALMLAAKKDTLKGVSIGLLPEQEGSGLIDAYETVK